jgi:hypothetical protein
MSMSSVVTFAIIAAVAYYLGAKYPGPVAKLGL